METEQASQRILLGEYAGFVTRLVAYVIDGLILTGIMSLVGMVITWALNTLGLTDWFATAGTAQLVAASLIIVAVASISIFYNIGFWMLAGQTPGKRIMGVRIVRTDGGRLRWGNAVRRQVGYWISNLLWLGYLWILLDNRRQGWHDKLAGTIVVHSWPEDEITPMRDRLRRFRQPHIGSQGGTG
jgi:uncharacterized RDD family membrane protein YckC